MVHAFRRNRALTASVVVILLAILCAGGTSRAQAPVFKGRVDLVRLDVVVVNTDGDPVSELKPSDFAVTLAGQQSRVVLFEYVASDPSGSPSTLNSPVADAAGSPGQEPPVRTILFVLDDLGVLPGGIKELTIAAGRLIEGMGSQDLVGIATTSAPTAPIAPTLNRSSVVEVLRNAGMSGRLDASPAGLYVSVNEAIEIETGTPRETSVQVAQRECAVGETGWRGSGRPPRRLSTISAQDVCRAWLG